MAGTITFSGLNSGLDTSSWVEALVSVKQTTITSLQAEQEQKQKLLSVVNNIKSYFTSFQTALQKITDSQFGIASLDLFMQNLAISSNSSIVTATATTEAARQTYDVLVEKLATSTKATSGYIKRETLNADLDTTLGDLGARAGNITVNSQSFNIKESDTIKDLIKKFSDVGVIASFDEKQSKFTISCAINELDDSTTNLKTALKLQNTTILGASSGSIVYATKDTELYKLGLTGGKVKIEGIEHTISKSGNNYTISKPLGRLATINTIGQFLDYLKGVQVKAESAEIDDNGNISIRGAVIESVAGGSNLMDALKLGEVKERTVMESNNLTYQQYHAADLTTTLKELGIANNTTLITNGSSMTWSNTATLDDIKFMLNTQNVELNVDENGVITIDTNGAVISGTLVDALGLDVTKGGTTLSSSPHTVTYQAYGDTLLSELGVTNTMTYTAHRSDGTAITGSINNNAGLTVDGFIAQLKGQGLDASFDETTHQITIKDGYIDGTLATQLGMSSVTDYYQEYAVGSTTLEKLGATGDQTLSIDGGTAKTYAKTATLQSVINDIVAAGGTVTLKDGTITVADVTLTGTVPALLGFEAVTTGTTVTSGALTVITNNSSTSSAALDENKFYNITMSSKLGDITGSTNSYTLTVNGTSSNLTKDSTLQDVANAVTAKGGTFTINDDNTVTVDGVTLGGTLVTALGLATVGRGTEMTSGNPITTGGDTEIVTGANTLAQLGSTGNTALSITNIATGTTTTKNYTTATTVDTVLADIRAAGGTATIEDGVIKISGQDKITLSGTALDAIHVSSTGSYSQITGNITYNAGYSTQTGALTPTLTRPLTLDTKLSDIEGLSTYQLITPAETKNFNSTDTLNTVKQYLISKGGNLEVDDEGKVTIEFTGNLTGSIATALKLAVTDQNTSMTSTNAITMNQSFLIDSDTTFGGTGTNSFNLAATARTYALYDTYGNVILAPSTSGTDGDTNKVSNWLSAINTAMNTYYGTTSKTYAKVENGVISIDGGYVSGDLPNAIGMTSSSTVSGKQLTGGVAQYTQESKFIGQVSNQIIPAGAQRASAVSSFSSGSIYLVSDASDLQKINTLASQTTGVTFILTNDIDLSSASSFTGIDGFKGTFLGNGYEIKNFSTTGAGFFKSVTGATIKDLGLVNINYTGTTDNKGGLVGSGSVTIDNCYVSGGTIAGSAKVAGGLAGNVNGTITNSYASVNIESYTSLLGPPVISGATSKGKGGLVGIMTGGSISNCYASGDVNCSVITILGGFAGSISNTTVTNCYATGNVYIDTTSNFANIGGFVGNGTSSNITNSYSTGNASTSSGNGNIGSFAGSPTGITFNTCIYNNEVGPTSGGTNASTTGIQGWSHSAILADGNSLPKLTGNNPYIYREILSNTTLAQIGLTTTSDRQISITVDGNNYTNTFASNATVQDVVTYLNGIDGIRATFENSQLNVQSLTSQNIDMGGKVTTALGGTGLTQSFVYATKNGNDKIYYHKSGIAISAATRVGDLLGTDEGGSLSFLIDGVQVDLSYEADSTLGEVMSDMAIYGINASIAANGTFSFTSDKDVTGMYGNIGSALLGAAGVISHTPTEFKSTDTVLKTSTSTLSGNSTLESIGVNSGTIQVVGTDGSLMATIDIDNSKTINQLNSMLSAYGFTVSIDSTNKILTITTPKNDRLLVDETSNLMSKFTTTTPATATGKDTTTLAQLGYSDGGSLQVTFANGDIKTLSFSGSNTIAEVLAGFNNIGIRATINNTNGNYEIVNTTQDFSLSGGLSSIFNGTRTTGTSQVYESAQLTYTTNTVALNGNAKIMDILHGEDIEATLRLTFNDEEVIDLVYDKNDTVNDVLRDLANLGINATISATGVFSAECDDKTFIISGNVGRALQGASPTYTNIDNKYKSDDLSYYKLNKISNNTTLKELGIDSGGIYVLDSSNQVIGSINIDEAMTLQQVRAALSAYGFTMGVDGTNSKVTISSSDGYSLADGSSNMVTGLKLDTWATTTAKLTTATTLAQMGFKEGADLNLLIDGSNPTTISFGAANTVQDIINSLAALDINASVNNTNGAFTATSTKHSFVFSGDLGKFLTNGTAGYVNSDKGYVTEEPLMETFPLVTNTSKLLDFSHALAATDTVESMGFADGGVIRLILDEDTQYSLSFLATDTMQDIMDTLASYGIGTTISANGSVALRNDDHTFTLGGALGSWLVQGGTYTNKETGYISDPLGYETTENIDTNTKLSQLGVAPGSLNIVHDGLLEPNSIQIDEETTLGQLMNALKVYDVASSILTDAAGNTRIQLYATGDTVLQDGTCDAVSKLGLEVIKQGDYDSHIEYWDTGVASGLLTEDTLLTSLDKDGKTSVGSLIFELGTGADAVQHIVNISAEDTIGSFLEKMSNEGVHAVLDNGVIKLDNSVQGITFIGGTSEIFDTLGIAQGAIDTYSTSSAALTYEKDITYSVANFADKDTLLSTVNVTDGKMSIFIDGIKCEVNVNSTDKFSDVFSKISSAVSAATSNTVTVNAGFLDKDGNIMINTAFDAAKNTGIIGIEVVGDHKLVIGASNDTTNFATIANLQQESSTRVAGSRALYKVNVNSLVTGSGLFKDGNVTTGDFKIGDAVITIDSTTTLNDLINQINKSDKSYASAYWDTLSGTLVIQSTLTGESLINIESGTSNFTDIMGFTEKVAGKETLVTDLQTLGQNAQVRINGTLVTATSNTITSDVSKIKGLTINLKGLSEGEATTITVEQDDEGIYNAVSDIVDAYNTLMEGLEKELAEDGSFAHNAMFKMMKNNLKNLMTRSISGSPLYKNLAAVGISTGEAQDSISTDVTALIIDKDKFMEALDKNSDAVKQLIVGTQANKGVFLQAINIVDSTLKSTGYISSTEKTITKDITKLGKKISSLTEQLAHYREQLEKKFSSMERVISGLQTSYSGLLSS